MSNENKHLTWKQCYILFMMGHPLYTGQKWKATGWWFFTRFLPRIITIGVVMLGVLFVSV